MAAFLDVCRFTPTAGGTTDWTYSTAVLGYQSPASAGAVNGAVYRYRAESADLTQWEVGYGAYNSSTGVFARTVVLFNSLGTTAKISFSTVPQVAIVALAEDLTQLTNALILNAANYGVVADGTLVAGVSSGTNNYTNMQAFLTALGNAGGVGIIPPGNYFVGSQLVLALAAGKTAARLIANGACILTDQTQYIGGLQITDATAVTREDEARKVVVEGLAFDHFENVKATFGIQVVGSVRVILRDIKINAGADNSGRQNYANYFAIQLLQGVLSNDNTGDFWCRIEDCTIHGATYPMPVAIEVAGQANALVIDRCDIDNATYGVAFSPATDGSIANGVRITNNDFEGVTNCISFLTPTSGVTRSVGLIATGNRAETCTTFFQYTCNVFSEAPPVIGPNYLTTTVTTPVYNPNNLAVLYVGGQLPATATNDNALVGNVGEFVQSTVLIGSAVALTTNVPANVTSISLTAGDWDVRGLVAFGSTATGLSGCISGISTVSATLPSVTAGAYTYIPGALAGMILPSGPARISIASTTTVYLIAYSVFTGGTQSAYGGIYARRAR